MSAHCARLFPQQIIFLNGKCVRRAVWQDIYARDGGAKGGCFFFVLGFCARCAIRCSKCLALLAKKHCRVALDAYIVSHLIDARERQCPSQASVHERQRWLRKIRCQVWEITCVCVCVRLLWLRLSPPLLVFAWLKIYLCDELSAARYILVCIFYSNM